MHYGLSGCHRVTRSVMAAEVHALIHAVDMGMIVQDALSTLFNCSIEVEAFVDCRTLFNVATRNSNTAERRLQNDVFALPEGYNNGELKHIKRMKSNKNPEDVLRKELLPKGSATWAMINKIRMNVDPVGWAIRKNSRKSTLYYEKFYGTGGVTLTR